MVCAGGSHTVEVKDIAPDLTLSGVTIPTIEMSKLKLCEKVGEGSWGAVFRAEYTGDPLWEEQESDHCQVSLSLSLSLFVSISHTPFLCILGGV